MDSITINLNGAGTVDFQVTLGRYSNSVDNIMAVIEAGFEVKGVDASEEDLVHIREEVQALWDGSNKQSFYMHMNSVYMLDVFSS